MAKLINTKENRIFKDCRRLSQRKYRDEEAKYLIEGPNLIREAFASGAEIDYIILDRQKADNFRLTGDIYITEHKLFEKLAQTETSQGILAAVKKKKIGDEIMANRCPKGFNIVILDRLQDPGNAGAIVRTAEGAGYGAVILMKGTADIYSPKAVRAAAGSVFRMPIILVEDDVELKRLTVKLGKKLTVTVPDSGTYYCDADLRENVALVIGNEGGGVSEGLMEKADIKVRIPMGGRLESLNASVAAGILMYESVRHREKDRTGEID